MSEECAYFFKWVLLIKGSDSDDNDGFGQVYDNQGNKDSEWVCVIEKPNEKSNCQQFVVLEDEEKEFLPSFDSEPKIQGVKGFSGHRIKPSVNVDKTKYRVQDNKDKEDDAENRVPDVKGLRLVLEPSKLESCCPGNREVTEADDFVDEYKSLLVFFFIVFCDEGFLLFFIVEPFYADPQNPIKEEHHKEEYNRMVNRSGERNILKILLVHDRRSLVMVLW